MAIRNQPLSVSHNDPPSIRTHDLAALFADFTSDANSSHDPQVQRAVYLARTLQQRATALQTPEEKRQQSELDRMIQNPNDKATLTQLTDQAFRARVPQRAVDQLIHILDVQGIPRFFSPIDRTLLRGVQSFGSYFPGVAVPPGEGEDAPGNSQCDPAR